MCAAAGWYEELTERGFSKTNRLVLEGLLGHHPVMKSMPSWLKSFAASKKQKLEEHRERERERETERESERERETGESERIVVNKQIMGARGASEQALVNKQIRGARGASELCLLIEACVADFNHVVTAPHTCLSNEHANMTF
jgi:hypothetical protein